MTYTSANFDENEVVLGEATMTPDNLIELYQNDSYVATISVDHILETLQNILDEDLNDLVNIEEDGDEWIKATCLRIAASALRLWVDEYNE